MANGIIAVGGRETLGDSLLPTGPAVEDEHEWNPELYMDIARLEERLKILSDGGYNVLAAR